MARAHYVKKARKDNPAVQAGEPYYWWQFRFGPKQYSKTPPRPSQLTQSEYLGQLYGMQEEVGDMQTGSVDNGDLELSDLVDALEDIQSRLEDLGQECDDKHGNMPEGLQDSETGELLQTRVSACENMAASVEEIADRIKDIELSEEEKKTGKLTEEHIDMINDALEDIAWEDD